MIEIEKKFLLTPTQQQALLNGAQEIGEKSLTDIYFDTTDYRLTRNNFWLRTREGAYELKVPSQSASNALSPVSRFHEITTLSEICQELGLNSKADFEEELAAAGIAPIIECSAKRKSYEKQGFHIDIDSASYAGSTLTYTITEIELLVESESEADEAERRIIAFAKSLGLETNQFVPGKIAAYLEAENPQHHTILVDAGILARTVKPEPRKR